MVPECGRLGLLSNGWIIRPTGRLTPGVRFGLRAAFTVSWCCTSHRAPSSVTAAACCVSTGVGMSQASDARSRPGYGVMGTPSVVERACANIGATLRRTRSRWFIRCPRVVPASPIPSVDYAGGALSTGGYRRGFLLDVFFPTGDPNKPGNGHWTYAGGSASAMKGLLRPTDAAGPPESHMTSRRTRIAGRSVTVYRVAAGSQTLYAGHVVLVWSEPGQVFQLSVHRWLSDQAAWTQASKMLASILRPNR
jgi:hypothetical protein